MVKAQAKADLRSKSVDELRQIAQNLDSEIAQLKLKQHARKLDNVRLVSVKADELAVVKTIMREKEIAARLAAKAPVETTTTEDKE